MGSHRLLLHLGYPKTGSSTLQHGIWKYLDDCGKLCLKTWRLSDENEPHDMRPSSRLFQGKRILPKYLDFSDSGLNVLSDESFTAPVRLRRNNFGVDLVDPLTFPKLIADQLAETRIPPSAIRVLVVLRNHADLLYSQYVEEYNLRKFRGVDLLYNEEGRLSLEGYEIYRYGVYVQELFQVFGQENVTVLFFESWKENPRQFADAVAHLSGADGALVHGLCQQLNLNAKNRTTKGYKTRDGNTTVPFLSADDRMYIRDFFRPDTTELTRLIGKEDQLGLWGYL